MIKMKLKLKLMLFHFASFFSLRVNMSTVYYIDQQGLELKIHEIYAEPSKSTSSESNRF